MSDVRFSTQYAPQAGIGSYAGADTRTNIVTSTRLSKSVINVKDWGAVGNGIADDAPKIAAAILVAEKIAAHPFSFGCTVYIPPGTYYIGSQLHLRGTIIGAGRDVTILRGDYSAGTLSPVHYDGIGWVLDSPRFLCWSNQGNIDLLADLTVWNDSQVDGSGAYFSFGNSNTNPTFRNIHFHGVVGSNICIEQYGHTITNCLATCSRPITRADSATKRPIFDATGFPGPGFDTAGSVGFYTTVSHMINCRAVGFDVGFALSGSSGIKLMSNTAFRCYLGFVFGLRPNANDGALDTMGGCFQSNTAERCLGGTYIIRAFSLRIMSNVFSAGEEGPHSPAPIPAGGAAWAGGTVTINTGTAHNLDGNPIRLFLTPSALAPAGGIVTPTIVDSTHFSYSLADPGVTSGTGTWNYAPRSDMFSFLIGQCFFAANTAATPFDTPINVLNVDTGSGQTFQNICMSMLGPGGWAASTLPAAWELIMCGKGGSNPPSLLRLFSQTYSAPWGPFEGHEVNISDGHKSTGGLAAFDDIVAGGSAQHMKIRYDGTNWRRVG